jgi:gliding motility-associated-like protein
MKTRTLYKSFFFILLNFSYSQVIIQNNLNAELLVKNVLFKDACATTSNFSFSSNQNVSKFINSGNNFPFTEGIVLRSGNVGLSAGNYQDSENLLSSTVNNNSDAYLSYLSSLNGQSANINDVAFLEFDFNSTSQFFNFNFIFASNEYGEFQCSFSDVFAFVLTDLVTNQSVNIAVLPGTNIPISISNIKDNAYNSTCESINKDYFDKYNVINPTGSPINFRGQTKLINANASIIPNRNYRLKLVIGDYYDSNYDSAVFVSNGSFNTPLNIGNDFPICLGDEVVVNTNIESQNYQFTWKKDNEILSNTTSSLVVTEPGLYKVIVNNINTNCSFEDGIEVTTLNYTSPTNIFACYSNNTNIFNLNANNTQTMGLNPEIYEIHYFNNSILIPVSNYNSYVALNGTTLVLKIYNKITHKYCISTFDIQLQLLNEIAINPIDTIKVCENNLIYNLNSLNSSVLSGNNPSNFNVNYYYNQQDAENSQNQITNLTNFQFTNNITIWAKLEINNGDNCFDVSPITFEILNLPLVSSLPNITICGQYILPVLEHGMYYTLPSGEGNLVYTGTIINNTTTLYIYNQNDICANQTSFTITIINNINYFNNINACNSYTLPQVPYGNVFTGPNGSGTIVTAGTTFTTNQILYHYHTVNGDVCSNYSFQLNITIIPQFDLMDDVRIYCGSYTLPALSFGQYFTQPNGGGQQLFAGDILFVSQIVYIYYQLNGCIIQTSFNVAILETNFPDLIGCGKVIVPANSFGVYYSQPNGGGEIIPTGTVILQNTTIYLFVDWDSANCSNNNPVQVIINPIPDVITIQNVVTCTSYTLPILNYGNYFTSSNGNGLQLAGGSIINTSQTLFIFYNNGTCSNESIFNIKIINTNFQTINACIQYTIPNNSDGKFYQNPNGEGEIPTGSIINSSQTLYFYSNQISTIPNCTINIPIEIIIHQTPQVDTPQNINTCYNYILPNLVNGQYYTQSGGTGSIINSGTIIQENSIIYIFNTNGFCNNETSFSVNIINTELQDVKSCGSYSLPTLSIGNYYTEPNGNGTLIPNNQLITTSQTIYYFVNTNFGENCTLLTSFYVEILPIPLVSTLNNVKSCESFTLPNVEYGNFYTLPNGQGNILSPGDIITNNATLYIYNNDGICQNQTSFEVIIYSKPEIINYTDINVCFNYILPQLPSGAFYYTQQGANGENLIAGTIINQNKTLFIYIPNPNLISCYSESQFTINILGVEAPQLDNVNVCDSFQLSQLTIGEYYTQPNKGGQNLLPGTIINNSQLIYIYVSNINRIPCYDEKSFMINISKTPVLGNFPNVFGCGSYSLPPLVIGNYYSQPNGQGQIIPFNTEIKSNQTIYVFAQNPQNINCKIENSFNITIYPLKEFSIPNQTLCVDPMTNKAIQPVTLNSGIDTNKYKVEWILNNQLVGEGKIYTTSQEGIYTIVTTKLTPEAPYDCNYKPTQVVVNKSSKAIAEINISQDFENENFIEVNIIKGLGDYIFKIDNEDFQNSNIFKNVKTGFHTITIRDIKGNCGDIIIENFIINYPKFFTPNQDGFNDYWNITDLYDFKDAKIKIFDRYGKFLIEIFPNKIGWNGEFNNQEMPSTDYWFIVDYTKDNQIKQYKAHFTLKR